jgi:hypothetical protein
VGGARVIEDPEPGAARSGTPEHAGAAAVIG